MEKSNKETRIVNLEKPNIVRKFKPIATVYQEEDYNVFTTFKSNRTPDHYDRIMANILEKGWITNPILTTIDSITGNVVIVDGMNRFCALRELGMPIQFVILDNATENDMITLNLVSKNWTKHNYAIHWAAKGLEDYRKLIDVSEKYNEFTFTTIVKIMNLSCENDSSNGKNNYGRKRLESGEFKIKDMKRSIEVLEFCMKVKEFGDNGKRVYNQDYFATTIMRLYKNMNFNPYEMLHKIDTNRGKLFRCNDSESYRKMLEDIYNTNRRGKSACSRIHLEFVR